MPEFKPIETQEALDAIIKDRIERAKKSAADETAKKYEGYLSPDDVKKHTDQITALTDKLKESETKIADLTAKNSAYEIASVKTKIAHEVGLPYELADRLSGTTEEEIRKDADALSKFAMHPQATPSFSAETPPAASADAAYRALAHDLNA
jgi:hypothetical protein